MTATTRIEPVVRNNNIHVSVLFCFYLFIESFSFVILILCVANFRLLSRRRQRRWNGILAAAPLSTLDQEPKKIGKLVILTLDSFDSISLDLKKSTMLKLKIFGTHFDRCHRKWTKMVGKLVILTLYSFDSICSDSKKSTVLKLKIFGTHFDRCHGKWTEKSWKIGHSDTGLIRFHLFRFEKINHVESKHFL